MTKAPQPITEPSSSAGRVEALLTTNRKIFRAAAVVAVFSSLVALASTARELVVARWFGRGDAVDAFLIAYLLPLFFVNLAAGSFNSAVIPTFIQVRKTEGEEAAQRLFSGVMLWSLALMAAITVLLGMLAPFYLPLLGSGFNAAKLILTRRLLYVLLPFVMLSGLAVIWTAVLNAQERFALPALLPLLTPASALVFVLLAGKGWGIFALAAGTVAGAAAQAVILAPMVRARGLRLGPRWYGFDPHLRQVIGQYAPLVAGALLMGSTDLVDQSMAAMLAPGSVAALSYGRKLVSLFVVIGALPLSSAVLPYFSQIVASEDWAALRHTLRTASRLVLLATVPITAGLVLFSGPLIKVLFQRGAFTAQDTKTVSNVQALLALEIPFYILGNMAVRVVSALKRNAALMKISAVNMLLNVVLNYAFMRYWGVAGIALSTSIVYLVSCFLVYGAISAALKPIENGATRWNR